MTPPTETRPLPASPEAEAKPAITPEQVRRWLVMIERADRRSFKFDSPPVEPTPRFFINGNAVCTPGNLANLIAQAKAGKTSYLGAMIVSALCAAFQLADRDTLGVTASAPSKKILLHIDTEQSVFDHDALVRRALKRAGIEKKPDWLWSYGLAGFSASELHEALPALMWQAGIYGGLFAVIIDGTADLANDVNDAEECNGLVAELHALAIQHDCPIVNVLHENPGQDSGKMRGHLGSQLERKAETNLRLKKADEITVVFSEKCRRAPIFERDGPRFAWSNQDGMHLSVQTLGNTRDDTKRDNLRDQAEAVFIAAGVQSLAWGAFREGIEKSEGIGQSGARKRFDTMKKLGVIQKNVIGHWTLKPLRPGNAP